MALIDLAALKRYLRVQTTLQDTLLTELLAQATALTEAFLNQPITAVERTVYVDVDATYGHRALVLPGVVADDPAPVVEDADGTAVEATEYRVDTRTGTLVGLSGYRFRSGPYAVTATIGLSAHPQYATLIEPVINSGIRDYAADLYQRRNPAAGFEAEGAGVSTTYNESANLSLPSRITATLAPWRRRNV